MQTDYPNHTKRVYNSIEEMLSNQENPTPLLRLNKVIPFKEAKIYAKLEWYNPFGAVKDRIAANLLADAKEKGLMKDVEKLVEPTSGNTGFALTMLANQQGYGIKSPLSSMIPLEKRILLRFFGCDVIEVKDQLCPAPGAPEGAISLAMEMAQKKGFYMLDQYSNRANPNGHYKTTGPEIWRQTEQKVTHFVASLGTCGTLTGTGMYLKEKNPLIQLVGVHPKEGHDIPGVRSLVQLRQTKLFMPELYDHMIEVTNREAYDMCLRLNREESIIAGPSSGLAVAGALKVIQDDPNAIVVIIFPDNAFKYASSFQRHFPELFKEISHDMPSGISAKSDKEVLFDQIIEISRTGENTVGVEEAYRRRQVENPLYIDVRSYDQYSSGHITGAINIPLPSFVEGDQRIPEDRDSPMVLICNLGNQSLQALLALKTLGYRRVKSLNGGTNAWIEKGFPIEKDEFKLSPL